MSEINEIRELSKEQLEEIEKNMVVPPMKKPNDKVVYPNDITKILYSLPLTEKQRKKVYKDMMKQYKNNPNPDDWFPKEKNKNES